MKSRKGPITLIVFGLLLFLGPVWGVLGTIVGMIRAFGTLEIPGAAASGQLASDVEISLWATMAGLIMSPIGLALFIGGIVWLVRISKKNMASYQQMQTTTDTIEKRAPGTLGEEAPEWVVNIARNTPPKAGPAFRVVVIEADGRQGVTEFQVLDEALQYADDVASEPDVPMPIAYVFTPGLKFVRQGRHYAAP